MVCSHVSAGACARRYFMKPRTSCAIWSAAVSSAKKRWRVHLSVSSDKTSGVPRNVPFLEPASEMMQASQKTTHAIPENCKHRFQWGEFKRHIVFRDLSERISVTIFNLSLRGNILSSSKL